MGQWTEEFNRYWFERHTGRSVIREQEWVCHPSYPWLAATLDGVTVSPSGDPAVFEAKHVGSHYKLADIRERYYPQLQHQMFVTNIDTAALSVFFGNKSWEYLYIDFDPWYHADLLAAERAFWRSVSGGQDATQPLRTS
jgi:predicted phage-related endonuclease